MYIHISQTRRTWDCEPCLFSGDISICWLLCLGLSIAKWRCFYRRRQTSWTCDQPQAVGVHEWATIFAKSMGCWKTLRTVHLSMPSSVVAGKGPEGSVPEGVVMLRHIPSTVSSRLLSVKEVASRTINSSHWKPMLLRWYLICELEDDDFPAHPAELVTIRSLKKAFSQRQDSAQRKHEEFFYVRRSWEIDFWIFLVRGKHKYICVVLCLLNNTMFQFGKDLFGHIAWYVWSVTTPKPQAWDCGPANTLQDDKAKRRIPDWERFTFCEEGGKVWDRETSSETYDNPCKQMDSVCVLRSVQSTIIPCLACSTFPWSWHRKRREALFLSLIWRQKGLSSRQWWCAHDWADKAGWSQPFPRIRTWSQKSMK